MLQKYNNTDEVVFGSIRFQTLPGKKELMENIIPFHMSCEATQKVSDVLKRLQDEFFTENMQGFLPISEIQHLTTLKYDLFDSVITIDTNPGGAEAITSELTQECDIEQEKWYFDIVIHLDDEIQIGFTYDANKYDEKFVKVLEGNIRQTLRCVIRDPDIKLAEINILGDKEKNEIFDIFNCTRLEYQKDKTIHQLFEAQAERTLERVAVVFENELLTYQQLNERANQLVIVLRGKGVKPDSVVAVMLECSLMMPICLFAILKAGGTYLPISPDYPEDRIKYMLEDSKAKIILAQGRFLNKIQSDISIINTDDCSFTGDSSNVPSINRPNDLAYVIYTSGSTGKPKGVMIEHHSVINRIFSMQRGLNNG